MYMFDLILYIQLNTHKNINIILAWIIHFISHLIYHPDIHINNIECVALGKKNIIWTFEKKKKQWKKYVILLVSNNKCFTYIILI